ncbi:MAG TPA: L,D-transpeptidase family protein, partial [Thermoanaerobaculia bacterium]|nr:L,D-transpeptidase family protein [Thermoanaerobaculia bacterium]
MTVSLRTLALCAGLVALSACGRDSNGNRTAIFGGDVSRSWNPAGVKNVKGVPTTDFKAELDKQMASKATKITDEQREHATRLYKQYGSSPLWLDGDGLIKGRADALVDALVNATTDAINLDQYPLLELAANLDSVRRAEHPTAAQLARTDLLLTTSYVALSEDYLTGQIDPSKMSQSWHINTEEQAVDSALARSLREKDLAGAIGRMRPPDYDYDMLRRKLADYRRIVAGGGWQPIPAGKALKRGEKDSPARIAALRARLRAEGFRTDSASADTYDASLAAAVANFQAHHTIGVDSMLGQETVDALNVPATMRLAQIAANLERYRWLPRTLGNKYILVNVPAFHLDGFENGKKTIEMKVIVGAEYEGRATPVFSDKMEFVVFRPYWNVTPDIAEKEFFPKYGSNLPDGYEFYTEGGQTRIRQRPGPKNSLGLVKFMFPNDFNIYLHDT